MKQLSLVLILLFIFVGCENKKGAFLETQISDYDLPTTVLNFKEVLKKRGFTIFNTIDHQKNALSVKMDLKPETLIVFGNPKVGTMLMQCNASMGMELPLRVLITTNYEEITTLSYTNPEYWTLKHNIKDKKCLTIINKMKIVLGQLTQKASKK